MKLKNTANLVFLQEFELDSNITTQSFVFVSVDLVIMLSHVNADHGSCIPRAQTQLFQVGTVGIELKSACKNNHDCQV